MGGLNDGQVPIKEGLVGSTILCNCILWRAWHLQAIIRVRWEDRGYVLGTAEYSPGYETINVGPWVARGSRQACHGIGRPRMQ